MSAQINEHSGELLLRGLQGGGLYGAMLGEIRQDLLLVVAEVLLLRIEVRLQSKRRYHNFNSRLWGPGSDENGGR